MTREFFNKQFAAMSSVYSIAKKMSGEAQDVYWEMLKDIPEDKFAEGVKECLAESKFFPTIAELGEASMPRVTDYRTPLPPDGYERPTINWREQLQRRKQKDSPRLAPTGTVSGMVKALAEAKKI